MIGIHRAVCSQQLSDGLICPGANIDRCRGVVVCQQEEACLCDLVGTQVGPQTPYRPWSTMKRRQIFVLNVLTLTQHQKTTFFEEVVTYLVVPKGGVCL